jgi:hypothetical protein
MNKDLVFLAKVVTPDLWGYNEAVRLDSDGEVCFTPHERANDFYTENGEAFFMEDPEWDNCGVEYTKRQIKEARKELGYE